LQAPKDLRNRKTNASKKSFKIVRTMGQEVTWSTLLTCCGNSMSYLLQDLPDRPHPLSCSPKVNVVDPYFCAALYLNAGHEN